jgi:hypothetical protein
MMPHHLIADKSMIFEFERYFAIYFSAGIIAMSHLLIDQTLRSTQFASHLREKMA